jgi:hypothetical protein
MKETAYKILLITLTFVWACMIALAFYLAFVMAPILTDKFRSDQTLAACRQVRPGMKFAETDRAMHENAVYFREVASADGTEFSYSGREGTCTLNFSGAKGQLLGSRFDPVR